MMHFKNRLLKCLFEDWDGSEGGNNIIAVKAFGEHLLCIRMAGVRTFAVCSFGMFQRHFRKVRGRKL